MSMCRRDGQCHGRVSRSACKGAGAVEFLLAVPLVLLLGLGVWQWALVLHARQIIEFAASEAVRAGSLVHATEPSIDGGLALGLSSFWGDLSPDEARDRLMRASLTRLAAATRSGWLEWRQLSPTHESFADWGESVSTALAEGQGPAVLEIPTDNTAWRARNSLPASGRGGDRSGETVGAASGQTLLDASILRIELTLGVPLHVPLAGRFIAWVAQQRLGCPTVAALRAGALNIGAGDSAPGLAGFEGRLSVLGAGSRETEGAPAQAAPSCSFFEGPDHAGRVLPRLPVRVVAQARMQSGARVSARTPHRSQAVPARVESSSASLAGPMTPPLFGGADSAREAGPSGAIDTPLVDSDPPTRADGFLSIGGERVIWAPGACTMPPS